VCSRHREAAFQASRWIVDELKKKVPIWKRPRFRNENSVAGVLDAGSGSSIPARANQPTI
jgi:molybdopterin synthase catalytic subunit